MVISYTLPHIAMDHAKEKKRDLHDVHKIMMYVWKIEMLSIFIPSFPVTNYNPYFKITLFFYDSLFHGLF